MIRNITILFTLLFTTISVNSQTDTKELKTVQVLAQETFYLNGGNMATFGGGRSRIWYDIKLPKNTVEWYYTFSTSKGGDPVPSIKLFSQLTRIVDPSGMTAIAAQAILTPKGAAMCDVVLMDRPNADKFSKKVEYQHWIDGSRENLMQATVSVKDHLSGTLCLGFRNPSAVQGITVTFEVVAIVDTAKKIITGDLIAKSQTFANLGRKAYERGEYDKCMELSKMALELNPEIGWVHNNIGLVYLLRNDLVAAIDSYSSAIAFFRNDKQKTKTWLAGAIDDLNTLVAKKGPIEGSKDILILLISERAKK